MACSQDRRSRIRDARDHERARAECDLERAKYRARTMINFIEARATDITASLRLEEWVKDAISEAYELGPER